MANIKEMGIRVGYVINIDGGVLGEVVFSSIEDEFSEEYPRSDWGKPEYHGIMIVQENGALVFHDKEYLESPDCRVEVIEPE